MSTLSINQAKSIYRAAIDPRVTDGEGEAWWQDVRAEVSQVLAARTTSEAAAVIDWWHHDWTMVNDTARAAAKRLRAAARARHQQCKAAS